MSKATVMEESCSYTDWGIELVVNVRTNTGANITIMMEMTFIKLQQRYKLTLSRQTVYNQGEKSTGLVNSSPLHCIKGKNTSIGLQ